MKTIKEISIDSQAIYKRISTAIPGETILYSELSGIIGRDIQKYRSCLYTALSMALRENNMVFDATRGIGITRLKNDQIPGTVGGDALMRIRRVSKKAAKKIVATDYDNLPNDLKIKHNANLSILGAFCQMTKQKAVKQIEDAINLNDINKLTYAKTLEQFKKA